jgi:hypothetical protein
VSETIDIYVLEALGYIQEEAGEMWGRLTEEEEAAAARAARRVLEINIQLKQARARGANAAEVASLNEDLEFVKVTVGEFKVAGELALTSAFQAAFWKGVNKALEALGSFLAGAGKGLIPGL